MYIVCMLYPLFLFSLWKCLRYIYWSMYYNITHQSNILTVQWVLSNHSGNGDLSQQPEECLEQSVGWSYVYFYNYHQWWLYAFISKTSFTFSTYTDRDLNKEGFSLESCRSMIAFMDVSFVKWSAHLMPAQEATFVVDLQNTYSNHTMSNVALYIDLDSDV